MKLRAFSISVILLLFGVVGCGVPRLDSIATPSLAPNRIETGVAATETAWAEQTAIAATLIAKASKVTQVPTSAKTPESTLTSLPLLPTATYVVRTPTSTLTNTPAVTNTAIPIPTNTVVRGGEYGVRLKGVKKIDSYSFSIMIALNRWLLRSEPDHVALEVGVEFYKNGIQLWDDNETRELSVVDSRGNVYQVLVGTTTVSGNPQTGEYIRLHYTVYFSVPNTAAGFKLRYRDLPTIDLGM